MSWSMSIEALSNLYSKVGQIAYTTNFWLVFVPQILLPPFITFVVSDMNATALEKSSPLLSNDDSGK